MAANAVLSQDSGKGHGETDVTSWDAPPSETNQAPVVTFALSSQTDSDDRVVSLAVGDKIEIGRASQSTNKKLQATGDNCLFHCAVVSRSHAELSCRAGTWDDKPRVYITDLGSRHGTAVNGKLLETGEDFSLLSGDIIKLGDRVCRGKGKSTSEGPSGFHVIVADNHSPDTHDGISLAFHALESPNSRRRYTPPVLSPSRHNSHGRYYVPSASEDSDSEYDSDGVSDVISLTSKDDGPSSALTTPEQAKGKLGSQDRPIVLDSAPSAPLGSFPSKEQPRFPCIDTVKAKDDSADGHGSDHGEDYEPSLVEVRSPEPAVQSPRCTKRVEVNLDPSMGGLIPPFDPKGPIPIPSVPRIATHGYDAGFHSPTACAIGVNATQTTNTFLGNSPSLGGYSFQHDGNDTAESLRIGGSDPTDKNSQTAPSILDLWSERPEVAAQDLPRSSFDGFYAQPQVYSNFPPPAAVAPSKPRYDPVRNSPPAIPEWTASDTLPPKPPSTYTYGPVDDSYGIMVGEPPAGFCANSRWDVKPAEFNSNYSFTCCATSTDLGPEPSRAPDPPTFTTKLPPPLVSADESARPANSIALQTTFDAPGDDLETFHCFDVANPEGFPPRNQPTAEEPQPHAAPPSKTKISITDIVEEPPVSGSLTVAAETAVDRDDLVNPGRAHSPSRTKRKALDETSPEIDSVAASRPAKKHRIVSDDPGAVRARAPHRRRTVCGRGPPTRIADIAKGALLGALGTVVFLSSSFAGRLIDGLN